MQMQINYFLNKQETLPVAKNHMNIISLVFNSVKKLNSF